MKKIEINLSDLKEGMFHLRIDLKMEDFIKGLMVLNLLHGERIFRDEYDKLPKSMKKLFEYVENKRRSF